MWFCDLAFNLICLGLTAITVVAGMVIVALGWLLQLRSKSSENDDPARSRLRSALNWLAVAIVLDAVGFVSGFTSAAATTRILGIRFYALVMLVFIATGMVALFRSLFLAYHAAGSGKWLIRIGCSLLAILALTGSAAIGATIQEMHGNRCGIFFPQPPPRGK